MVTSMNIEGISGYCDPRFEEVAKIFSSAIKSGYETGASIAIEHQGDMVANLWGGYQDEAKTKRWQEDTIVNVFSVTKGVVATCAARLIEQGLLDIHQKVSHYWPEYGCNGKQDTKVIDLLCHRAGMFGFQGVLPIDEWRDWQKFTDLLAAQAPFRTPGASQGYHALTFGWLVGEVIRRVDGRSVGTYFSQEIAKPLGLDFKIGIDESDLSRCADTLMVSNESALSVLKIMTYVPDMLLSKSMRGAKDAVISGDYSTAFAARGLDGDDAVNSAEWRLAEVPAANGHGTAASLAKLYGVLSNGGSRNGQHLLKPETIKHVTSVHSGGPDTVLFGLPYQFGLGYMVNAPLTPIGVKPGMFGHTGIGGEVTFGDLNNNLGFSFVNNRQHNIGNLYKTANNLSKALYKAL
jgi:CubicO group peptidase (beta-lactamase class C family)